MYYQGDEEREAPKAECTSKDASTPGSAHLSIVGYAAALLVLCFVALGSATVLNTAPPSTTKTYSGSFTTLFAGPVLGKGAAGGASNNGVYPQLVAEKRRAGGMRRTIVRPPSAASIAAEDLMSSSAEEVTVSTQYPGGLLSDEALLPFFPKQAFFDIDGTIKPASERYIPQQQREALKFLIESGVAVYIATGRAISQVEDLVNDDELLGKLAGVVSENGGHVVVPRPSQSAQGTSTRPDWDVAFSALDNDPTMKTALSAIQASLAARFKRDLMRGDALWQANKVNLTLKPRDGISKEESMAKVAEYYNFLIKEFEPSGSLAEYGSMVHLMKHWDALDIVGKGVSKANGIQALGLDLAAGSVFAGDAENDPFYDLDALSIYTITHVHATPYAQNAVKDLGGLILPCTDYTLVTCIINALPGNPEPSLQAYADQEYAQHIHTN